MELISETRSGTMEKVKEEFQTLFSPKVLEEVLELTDSKDFSKVLNTYHKR
jgi:predicted house-cleaning noncanonical NTP pyrophosphatase (MazG superfamily)